MSHFETALTQADIAEMKRCAEAASQGLWEIASHDPLTVLAHTTSGIREAFIETKEDAAHIVASNPQAVRAIIAALRAEKERAREARKQIEKELTTWSTAGSIRLHAGELSAAEMRAVRAVVGALSVGIRRAAALLDDKGEADA